MKCVRIHRLVALMLTVAVTATCGCGSNDKTPSATTVTSTPSAPPKNAPAVPDMSAALSGKKRAQGTTPTVGPTTDQQVVGHGAGHAAPEEVQEVRQVAVAGVGKKGSRYGGGIISEPVSQYFGARERITFISIQKAMRTFQAMHDRLPNSHEEFMAEIVQENGLELPGLLKASGMSMTRTRVS